MQCDVFGERLPAIADGREHADLALRRHVDACLRCQAELVQYRKLLRLLRQVRTEVMDPAPGLLTDVLAGLSAAGERRAVRSILAGRRAAYVGGIAAATAAAGAAGAIVLVTRARHRKALLAG
jgi:hypothetical protein